MVIGTGASAGALSKDSDLRVLLGGSDRILAADDMGNKALYCPGLGGSTPFRERDCNVAPMMGSVSSSLVTGQ